jgi:hypothetical protein
MRARAFPLVFALLITTALLGAQPSSAKAQAANDPATSHASLAVVASTPPEHTLSAQDLAGLGDPVGDVPYCQGDITAVAADVSIDFIALGLWTACGSDPTADPSWTTGVTEITWLLDLNGDGAEEYTVFFDNITTLDAAVYATAGSTFDKVCDAIPDWEPSGLFVASFPSSCVSTPASASIQGQMAWDEDPAGTACVCPVDIAPDGFGFSAPIARSDCSSTSAAAGANALPTGGQGFTPLTPARIYDTRTGVGGTNGLPLGPSRTSVIQVTGVGGVPTTGVSAVVLNVTATLGTRDSYLALTPGGGTGTSSVNFRAGQDVPNLVTVPVGADGNVRVFNSAGCVHVVLDVFGYYGSTATSRFNAADPTRILDTRSGAGGVSGPLGPDSTAAFHVAGRGGVPANATAAVLNVTATEGTVFSYLSITPLGGNSTSNINFVAGQDRPNLVTVPLASDGTARVYNAQGAVHVLVDVMGWYGPTGSSFTPVTPARIVDTRLGTGGISGKLSPLQTVTAQVGGLAGVPTDAEAVVLNITGTEASTPTYLAVTPNGVLGTSNLNVAPAQDIANAAAVKVSAGGPSVRVFNAAGTIHVILDIVGWFGP